MHRKPFKLFAAALLLVVLFAAEALTVAHSLDFDAHTGGEPCKICISVAALGGGAPARAIPPEAPRSDVLAAVSREDTIELASVDHRLARGPPAVS